MGQLQIALQGNIAPDNPSIAGFDGSHLQSNSIDKSTSDSNIPTPAMSCSLIATFIAADFLSICYLIADTPLKTVFAHLVPPRPPA
jgi:hypothetical protein